MASASIRLSAAVDFSLNIERYRELVLHIASFLRDDLDFGRTKLAKVLYFCDFAACRELGEPITGVSYLHMARGPYPDGLLVVETELTAAHRARVDLMPTWHERLVSIGEPKVSVFSEAQFNVIGRTIDALRPLTTSQIVKLSHKELGYELTDPGEIIPYSTAVLPSGVRLSSEDAALIRTLIKSQVEAEFGDCPGPTRALMADDLSREEAEFLDAALEQAASKPFRAVSPVRSGSRFAQVRVSPS